MNYSEFLIIGAGMGGASCGYWLSEKHSVTVLEMETQPGYHTTGRSVAVYTEAYGPRTIRALAKSGYEFLTNPPKGFSDGPLSYPHPWIFVAREDQRQALVDGVKSVQELSPDIHEIGPGQVEQMVPVMKEGYVDSAMLEPNSLSLEVNNIHQGFLRGIKSNGGELVCDAQALAFERKGSKWHVKTKNDEYVCDVIINAAGAWADVVGEMAGASKIGLVPKQRTVIAFVPPNVAVSNNWPIVIDIDEEFLFKVDTGTVLASPADETPVPPQDARPEDLDVAIAVDRIENATTMKVGNIRRKWAGLRSFVKDYVPVVGYDTAAESFFWCAGQGGYGIETAYGMGRCSASLATGAGIPTDVSELGVSEADLASDRPSI